MGVKHTKPDQRDQVSSEDESSEQIHETDSSSETDAQASSPFRKKNDAKDCFIGISSEPRKKKFNEVTPPPKKIRRNPLRSNHKAPITDDFGDGISL